MLSQKATVCSFVPLIPPLPFPLPQTSTNPPLENRDIHQSIPDHRVKLTPLGWTQAHAAGLKLRGLLRPDDTVQFFTSPYTRTRETTQGILSTLCSDDPEPSPFPLSNIKVYEEPRLREQDFGNFQPCSAEMERMWQERADYGHFFYRIPNGESAADAYDRVAGFNESLWRQFGEDDCASVCVLVTHGLMSRVFLMKWYHFSVEYFEDLRNVDHCEFLIMRREENGKYELETKLRTWSGLKRERALALKEKAEKDEREGRISMSPLPIPLSSPHLAEMATGPKPGDLAPICPASPAIPKRKKWGGCPNGCDHGRFHYKKENSMHSMKQNGGLPSLSPVESPPIRRHFNSHFGSSSDEDEADPRGIPDGVPPPKGEEKEINPESIEISAPATRNKQKSGLERGLHKLHLSGPTDPLSSPSPPLNSSLNPPQYITRSGARTSSQRADRGVVKSYLQVGRDFGATSWQNSGVGSDTETDVDAEMARKAEKALWRQKVRDRRENKEGGYPGMGIWGLGNGQDRVRADGLGDIGGDTSDCRSCSEAPDNAEAPDNGDIERDDARREPDQRCQHHPHDSHCRGGDSEGDRGRSGTEREVRPGPAPKVKVDSAEEISPGSVQEVHQDVVKLGMMPEASESAEFDREEAEKESPVEADHETEEDRHEKSVAGQVR